MKHFLFLSIGLLILAACSSPQPTTPPIASTAMPVVATTPTPDTSALLPSVEKQIDLGSVNLDSYFTTHPIALDEQAGRLYVSTSSTRTIVYDAASLTPIGQLPVGGNLSIYPERDRLYIGVMGVYDGLGGAAVPGELRMYTASTLAFRRRLIFSDTAPIAPPYAVVDATADQLYIVHSGVYVADANSLEVSGTLSGTIPTPGGLVPNYYAVDAAIDSKQRRLFVSLNNGVPGSNNGNGLVIYDLTTGEQIASDGERSVASLAVDRDRDQAYVARGRMDILSVTRYDMSGTVARRLDGLFGEVQVDPARKRIYVLQPSRLVVLDLNLTYLGEVSFEGLDYQAALAFDPPRDRLLVLSSSGQLIVLNGHGQAAAAPSSVVARPNGAVQWLVPSPDFANDQVAYAAFSTANYLAGSGILFRSRDAGQAWEFVSGLPLSSSVSSLVFSPNYTADRTLFVSLADNGGATGGGSGIYRSTDDGRTWQPVAQGLTDLAIKQLAISPDFVHDRTLFAIGAKRGLFRSTDAGGMWTSLADRYLSASSNYPSPWLYAMSLSAQFASDNTLLISRAAGDVLISHDRGQSWQPSYPNSTSHLVFAPDPNSQTIFADSIGGLIRSDDGGRRWIGSNTGLDLKQSGIAAIAVSSNYAADQTAYVLVTSYNLPSRLYRTNTGGQTWSALQSQAGLTLTALTLANNGGLILGASDGRTLNLQAADLTFSPPDQARFDDQVIQSIAAAPNGRDLFIAGGSFGVWRSNDNGSTWQDANMPDRDLINPIRLILSPDYPDDQTVFAYTGHSVYRSSDRGQTWEALEISATLSFPVMALTVSPNFTTDRTLLVGGDYHQPSLLKSVDGGDSWTLLAQPIVITSTVPNRLAITADGCWWAWLDYLGLYRSDDQGATWTPLLNRSDTIIQALAFSPDYANDGTGFIGLLYGTLLRTRDAGQSWQAIGQGTFSGKTWLSAIAISPSFVNDRTLFAATDAGVYRSQDGGETWTAADRGLPPTNGLIAVGELSISADVQSDQTVWAAPAGGGLYVSRNGGRQWSQVQP